eukprot:TRINITY_DN26780_c0_g1_i1.p1 TRINITY_DN26780_c0_g1~~TRINITY_DN26780_c0_g1_i1.p1  ORF type:complete len:228 (+),score=52.61 TRINITY_DN26780_c0_g1_i1:47-685(+)
MAKKKIVKKKPQPPTEVSGKVEKTTKKQPAKAEAATENISDIFSGLKGKKKATGGQKKSTSAASGEAGAGSAGAGTKGPWVSGPHKGYINAGGNIASGKMTVQEAKAKALKVPSCMGFTFEGKPGKDGKVMLWLKNKYPVDNVLSEPNGGWTTYKVENRDPHGDAFMDLRGEGSSAKVKMTKDGFKVFSSDDLVMDNGGFTKECPFDCDCCF